MRNKARPFWVVGGALISLSCGDRTPVSPERTWSDLAPSLTQMAYPLILTVVDPVGDNTGPIDVVDMDMTFSNITGDYMISLTADPSNPFVGVFRININLYNQDTGTTNPFPSFFTDVLNDFDLANPTTQITLSGTNPVLLAWEAGDRVFTNSLEGTGNPDGISLFRSSVNSDGGFLTDEDFIAFAETGRPALVRIAPIPIGIDIKPGSDPNSINCNNPQQVITVAVVTSESFDATDVDHTTVTFEGGTETHVSTRENEARRHEEDVDSDGDMDLVLHFRLGETDLACASTEGTLTGETFDGRAIEGTDAVRMVEGGRSTPLAWRGSVPRAEGRPHQ